MDDNLKRMDVPPNPWFAQRVINNALLAQPPLPFWASLWRDLNTEWPIPQPAIAMLVILLFGFVFGLSAQDQDSVVEAMYTQNLLYETGGVL